MSGGQTYLSHFVVALCGHERLDHALDYVSSNLDAGRTKSIAENIRATILSGVSISEAFRRHPDLVTAEALAATIAGENAGKLEFHLARYLCGRNQP